MKKIIIGLGLMLTSAILYGFVHLSIIIYLPNITGWVTPPGRYGTAVSVTHGTIPIILSIIMGITGLSLICENFISKYRTSVRERANGFLEYLRK